MSWGIREFDAVRSNEAFLILAILKVSFYILKFELDLLNEFTTIKQEDAGKSSAKNGSILLRT